MALNRPEAEAYCIMMSNGFIRGIGLNAEEARSIVECVVTDAPTVASADIEAKARGWILSALA